MEDNSNLATIKDVALHAGVSIATVSRVLNQSDSVTKETRKRVVKSMKELNYNRNEVARSLKIRQTKTIGIIAPELSNFFFMEVIEAMERILSSHGYSMIITTSNDSVEEEIKKLQLFVERNVDALVVMPAGSEGEHFRQRSLSHIPLILTDRFIEGLEVDTVLTDNRYGVKQMVKALNNEGFNHIGYIGGDISIHTAKERLEGFLEAMGEFQIPIDQEFIFAQGTMTQSTGRELMREALSKKNRPNAFFIANDSLHIGATTYAMTALNQKELDQLVFASFDYLSYAPLLKLCHYAVAQPLEKIGNEVANLLLKRLAGNKKGAPEHIVLKPDIKILKAHGGKPFEL